jgi:syntaxin 16
VLDLIAHDCFCRYQANTGRRKCILLLILLIVGLVIVLIYKPRSHSSPPPPANPSGGLEGIGVGESKPSGVERPGLPRPPALPIGDDEE